MSEFKYWIPIIGIYFVYRDSKFGKFRAIYYVGLGWFPYQLICGFALISITFLRLLKL